LLKKFVSNTALALTGLRPSGSARRGVRWLGWGLTVGLLALLGYQLVYNLRQLEGAWQVLAPGAAYFLVPAILLVPLNWHLEVVKWRQLAQRQLAWPRARYWRAVLMGLTAGILTPNRLGDYGGRLLGVPRAQWAAVLVTTFLGGLAQWAAFLLLGWPGLVYVAGDLLPAGRSYWLFAVGPLALGAGTAYLLAHSDRLLRLLPGRWRQHVSGVETVLRDVKFMVILRAGVWACLRFSVYCIQLYLLLLACGLDLPVGTGLAGIAAIYLVQAGLPLPPGIGLATRAELGLLLWGHTPAAGMAVIFATTLLFSLNLLLPSLLGWRHIVKISEKNYLANADEIP
jgi:hypothetical protein